MKYRTMSRSDIEKKKEQYFDTVKIIHETIKIAQLDDNKESFEFAKDILINHEGMGQKEIVSQLLDMITGLFSDFLLFIISFIMALLSNYNNIDEKDLIVFVIIFSALKLAANVLKTASVHVEKYEIRMLRKMTYEQYVYWLKSIK